MPTWLIAAVAAALIAFGFGLGHHTSEVHWQAKWDKHMAADAKAVAAATTVARKVEAKQAVTVTKVGTAAAVKDQAVQDHTRKITKEIAIHVTPIQEARSCVSYGLVRVLDAAAQGVDPADLALPAGKSDDACAPVSQSDLARSVVENYGTARQNAVQLDALIQFHKEQADILNGDTAELSLQGDPHG